MPKFWTPQYTDYSKYKRMLEKEDSPKAAVFMLADSQLLFWKQEGFPWLWRVKCELPSRPLTNEGLEPPVKASYVGFANDDNETFYQMFVEAMEEIEVYDIMQIHQKPTAKEKAHLERSDVILVAGGDMRKGWELLETTMIAESIKWRFYSGAVVIGVGVGASFLGERIWIKHLNEYVTFEAMHIVPEIIATDAHDFLRDLIEDLGPGKVGINIPKGGGLIFNRDGLWFVFDSSEIVGTFEPVKKPVSDFHYEWQTEKLIEAVIHPPAQNEGMLIAQEKLKIKEKMRKEKGISVMTKEQFQKYKEELEAEEAEEIEVEIDPVAEAKAQHYRQRGNRAFEQNDAEGAVIMYKESLKYTPNNDVVWCNMAAAYTKMRKYPEAVHAANKALIISCGTNGKAWFRRGCAFLEMGDTDNAYQDFGEALITSAGDPAVKKKEEEALDRMEEEKKQTDQWMKEKKYEESLQYMQLSNNTATEIIFDDKNPLDRRGLELFYRTLPDKQCQLTVLKLDGMKLGYEGIQHLARGLGDNISLEILSLKGCYIRPHGAQCLAHALYKNRGLAELDLTQNGIRDAGLAHLCGTYGLRDNIALMKLVLAENNITDKEMSKLADILTKNTSLTELNLGQNRLGFQTARALSQALKENTTLQRLHLNENLMQMDSLWRLSSVAIGHPSLRILNMKGVKLSIAMKNELEENTKYSMVSILVGKQEQTSTKEQVEPLF